MYQSIKRFVFAFFSLLLILGVMELEAGIKKSEKGEKDEIQSRPATGLFDLQQNTVSNIQFYTTNYGIFGLDVARGEGGGYWPRGSRNQYIFGGGIWFACKRNRPDTALEKKYCEVSYNPNNGRSWMVPGRIEDGEVALENDTRTYRTYFSTDFNNKSGEPRDLDDGPNWPIWDVSEEDTLKVDRYFGRFIMDVNDRNNETYNKGPAFISGEDIFCTFKDTDLNYYDGGFQTRKNDGYPLRLQYEETIYSWGFGDYKDFIFMRYDIINMSDSILKECWMAPVLDVDLARAPGTSAGAPNDRVRFLEEEDTLNLAVQWTNEDRGERGYGFGYLGFDFLESPATWKKFDTTLVRDSNGVVIDTIFREVIVEDSTGFVRKDRKFYSNSEQLGLVTFRNWPIEDDPDGDEERYEFLASGTRDGDNGPGDKRFMMATGPYNMRPGDTVRVIVGVILANTSKGKEADGTYEDLQELIKKDKFAQKVYDENFRTPQPPDWTVFTGYVPLNNGVKLMWDSTAEISLDKQERGLDFLGYRLYRARRPELDTFSLDQVQFSSEYPSGSGPFGWKEIARWEIPTPFQKSHYRSSVEEDLRMPLIDSIHIVGPYYEKPGVIDSTAIRVVRIGQGINLHSVVLSRLINMAQNPGDMTIIPTISGIDTAGFSQPWGPYYNDMFEMDTIILSDTEGNPIPTGYKQIKDGAHNELFDSVIVGTLYLNTALLPYNPLFFRSNTVNFDTTELAMLRMPGIDGIIREEVQIDADTVTYNRGDVLEVYNLESVRRVVIDGNEHYVIDVLTPRPLAQIMTDSAHVFQIQDSIYHWIKRGVVSRIDFPEFEQNEKTQNNIIVPYFDRLTNGRTYVDIGDDNMDGYIDYNADPTKSEKLLNNIDYYYKMIAYDEGDVMQPTESKDNEASENLPNLIKTRPKAAPISNQTNYEITYVDSAKIGGLYNFQFFGINPDRVQQLFGGHELELEFQPSWNLNMLRIVNPNDPQETKDNLPVSLYHRTMRINDLTTGDLLFSVNTYFETSPCQILYRGGFTENSFSWVLWDEAIIDTVSGDTITFGTPDSREIRQRSGHFTSGDFTFPGYCYGRGFAREAYGTFGFSFDYSLQQWGGRYRGDETIKTPIEIKDSLNKVIGYETNTSTIISGDAVTPISLFSGEDASVVFTTQTIDRTYLRRTNDSYWSNPFYGSFNNGPGNYLVEFQPGGEETMEIEWGEDEKHTKATFKVKYLTMSVKNVIEYNRPTEENKLDSVLVRYSEPLEHIELGTAYKNFSETTNEVLDSDDGFPHVKSLGRDYAKMISSFNLYAAGWVDSRQETSAFKANKNRAHMVVPGSDSIPMLGHQGRYYLSAVSTDGQHTIDFAHGLTVGGVQFGFDYFNKGLLRSGAVNWKQVVKRDFYTYGPDFETGDQVMLKTLGGALGLPLPGAKVRVKISEAMPEGEKLTDDLLEDIMVVPNPYYITHQGEKSPYDTQLFFTKLPPRCTIEIYTIMGDLVKTIEHDEFTSSETDKHAIEIWDLLSENVQRVHSQTLIAYIKTPDGAETVKRFSIVVGGYRLIQE